MVSVYSLERTNEQYIKATGRNLKTVLRIIRIINVYNIQLKLSLSYTIKTNLHIKVKYLD